MRSHGAVRTVGAMANDQVMTLEPAFAGAALAGIRVQLETAAFHLQQALEREARLRQRLERAGVSTSAGSDWAAVDAVLRRRGPRSRRPRRVGRIRRTFRADGHACGRHREQFAESAGRVACSEFHAGFTRGGGT